MYFKPAEHMNANMYIHASNFKYRKNNSKPPMLFKVIQCDTEYHISNGKQRL